MLRKISSYKLSEFKKNVAVIFSGSIISQVILIGATPWLTRLYTPEQYGIFGLFLGIVTIAGAFATLRYGYVIQTAEKKSDAQRMLHFCQLCALAISLVLLLIIAAAYNPIINLLRANELGVYIFLLPVATFFVGLIETYSIWLSRNKNFKRLSYNRITLSVVTVGFTILWAYFIDQSFRGLLLGQLTAQGICLIFLYFESRKYKEVNEFSWAETKLILRTYKHFPMYSLPADIINVFINQLPVFMLNRFASSAEVGHFNMSNRILGLPSVFISTSVGEVFRQRATEDYHKTGTCRPIFLKTVKTLFLIGVVPFLTVAIFGPWLFSFVLGGQWNKAGEYSRILSLMLFLRFCISPVTYVFYIAQKQRADFFGHILMFISTALPFYIGFVFFEDKLIPIMIFSVAYSLVYLYYFIFSYKFSAK